MRVKGRGRRRGREEKIEEKVRRGRERGRAVIEISRDREGVERTVMSPYRIGMNLLHSYLDPYIILAIPKHQSSPANIGLFIPSTHNKFTRSFDYLYVI